MTTPAIGDVLHIKMLYRAKPGETCDAVMGGVAMTWREHTGPVVHIFEVGSLPVSADICKYHGFSHEALRTKWRSFLLHRVPVTRVVIEYRLDDYIVIPWVMPSRWVAIISHTPKGVS